MAYKPQSRPGILLDPTNPINRGLVGWWPLNEGGGNRVNDISLYNAPGTIIGASQFLDGVTFDGSTNYITMGDASQLEVNGNSIAFIGWFYLTAYPAVNKRKFMFTKAGVAVYEIESSVSGYTGNIMRFTIYNTATGAFCYADSTTVPPLNTWFFVSFVFNHLLTKAYVYYNGVLEGTSSGQTGSIHTNHTGNFEIGRRGDNAEEKWKGKAKYLRIYNRVPSKEEINQLYTQPSVGLYTPNTAKYFVSAGGGVTVTATAQGLTLTGQAPTILGDCVVSLTAQALTLAQQAPAVSGAAVVQPTAQALLLALQAPAVTTDGSVIVSVSAQTLSLAQQNPVVSGGALISPTAQSLSLAQQAPVVGIGVTVTPSVLALISAAYGPAMLGDGAVTPGNLHLALGLNEPSIPGLGITIYPTYLSLTVSVVTGLTVETTDAWLRRQNVDSGGWSNRRVTSATTVIGSGNSGFFIIGSIDGSMFWRPRHLRYGEIYAGPDLWTNRTTGTAMWVRR